MKALSLEARVGAIVLAALALLLYATFNLKDWGFQRVEGERMYSLFDSVAGLDKNAPVKMAGVPIGKVEEMGLEDSQAKVFFRIQPGVRIPEGLPAYRPARSAPSTSGRSRSVAPRARILADSTSGAARRIARTRKATPRSARPMKTVLPLKK